MKLFDEERVLVYLWRILRGIGWALLTVLIGMFIGFMVAGQNPFLIFWPPTWFHVIEFLS
ncbi:hypothetical protein FC62_GL000348 [Amylolactobacillus amylotrophicus DSM 20534]|uniref:Uncharacterized protein n=3 Tax=Amylolactobacillus TaxID=2767876 RepID=A0A0R1YS52_9LACO|nr:MULTISPECIES: DNA-directed RNA polymerase subunit beta [Amylolactobacillus]APT19073.1 hypothetical protein LA20533_07365 [Amylolactobacillus amylophilus DSM 20533 = JCM 1125]KRK38660.1 hypothetical protein FC62_GL000348 [Amylolactobacillus amylotrophicus DSM 20534]KRM42697.1 hypothetical protein FD40_GL000491 [Amylolactobacillus amylophilus DSM 20533 = JCM 1125]GED79556.1 hypothetical protein LAM01_00290 [Amylolactobacillus amylophilus]